MNSPERWHLTLATWALKRGGIVLHATEGVWGLACDPFDRLAVAALLHLKGRSIDKGLIVIGADVETFSQELIGLSDAQVSELRASWPGPVTWVLPTNRFPAWITGGRPSVATRVPAHDQARALCSAFGGPLVSTSANLSGRPPSRSSLQAVSVFHNHVDYRLPGEISGLTGPSEIRNLHGDLIRSGG
ncbi:MAG: L-threonylcarbamoyladenylate synthase, partial [Gammaproteobacteria bacterium]|nr:L-threonylcarbamoyladenylate synthase [Gammaproteobacteria bacterium]